MYFSSIGGHYCHPYFFRQFTIYLQNIKQYCNLVAYIVLYNIEEERTKI